MDQKGRPMTPKELTRPSHLPSEINLTNGQRVDIHKYPGCAFLLVRGSIAVRAGINTADGYEMKRIAILDSPGHDLFNDEDGFYRESSEENSQATAMNTITFEYAAEGEGAQVRAIPRDLFKVMAARIPNFHSLVHEARTRQNARLRRTALDSYQREYEARSQLAISQSTFVRMIEEARREEKERAETAFKKLLTRATDEHAKSLQVLLQEFKEEKERLGAEFTQRENVLREEIVRLQKRLDDEIAKRQTLIQDYIEATTYFLERKEEEKADSAYLIQLIHQVFDAAGHPRLTENQLFRAISGELINGDADFSEDEIPTLTNAETRALLPEACETNPVPPSSEAEKPAQLPQIAAAPSKGLAIIKGTYVGLGSQAQQIEIAQAQAQILAIQAAEKLKPTKPVQKPQTLTTMRGVGKPAPSLGEAGLVPILNADEDDFGEDGDRVTLVGVAPPSFGSFQEPPSKK